MTPWLVAGLLLAGAILMFLAALGVLRMPDLFTRMQASTKAGTLGAGLILLAIAIEMRTLAVAASAVLIVGFLFLTAPVAAHMIGRAAHRTGVRTWEGTIEDELREVDNTGVQEPSSAPRRRGSRGDSAGSRSGQG